MYGLSQARGSLLDQTRSLVVYSFSSRGFVWGCGGRRRANFFDKHSIVDGPDVGSVSLEVPDESRGRVIPLSVATTPGEEFHPRTRGGQGMSLRSVFHLQPMLDHSQEAIGGGQSGALGFAEIMLKIARAHL